KRVAFQQAPAHPVDDLLLTAARDDGSDPLLLAIAVRRKPAFGTSDEDSGTLVGDLLAELRVAHPGVEHGVAICVAGPQSAARQVSELSGLARKQATTAGFLELVHTPRRFKATLVKRLEHVINLVTQQLGAAGLEASRMAAETTTWELLSRLDVLMPRLEDPDDTDWQELLNDLEPWGRDPTVASAAALRDRLEALAARYASAGADVDLGMLRREAHEVLHVERRRADRGWAELRRLDADAHAAVRTTVGVEIAGAGGLHLPRPVPAAGVASKLHPGAPVLVSGESGVGKSAIVLCELRAAATNDPNSHEVVCLNLRQLPRTITELRDTLGLAPEELLREMSAPNRVLVLDGADIILERDDQVFAPLVRAALTAGVTPWVVSATDGRAAVRAILESEAGTSREFTVTGLEDAELDGIADRFRQLRRLVEDPRAKELLRRPAIADLLVRSGSGGLPLSEADALEIVWAKLVRNDERTTRGLPDARDQAMRRLAIQQFRREDAAAAYSSLDPAALAGLQREGLIRHPDRWQPLPAFGHDLLRTYALAKVLLTADDLVRELLSHGAPRWALPAARLAMQVLLSAPDTAGSPFAGRIARLQTAIDQLPAAGHGDRWADLPTEALFALPNAHDLLTDAWPQLTAGDATGLRRLLRVIKQRHRRKGVIDRLTAEPMVELVLANEWPRELHTEVHDLLCGWLRGLALAMEHSGHRLRVALRERLVARVAAGEVQLAETRREQEARLAARTPKEVVEDEERTRQSRAIGGFPISDRRRRWRELPFGLTDDDLLEELALLGADLGQEGESLLRRVATDAPQHLAPAVEEPLTGHSLATYSTELLIHLADAYYVDERDEDADYYSGMMDDGIRDHTVGAGMVPLAACYRGPFLALFRANLRAGVDWLNRMLNHAARARVLGLRDPPLERPGSENDFVTELDITGERRRYVGDGHVWLWYRGTGVGPYPCMSALQALELVCDEYLAAGVRLDVLVRLLFRGCENLAMPALVFGMLVRHLERVGSDLDPFLAEPAVWEFEFTRITNEYSSLAARTDGIVGSDRRKWSPRDIAVRLVHTADNDRVEALRAVGKRLFARAAALEGQSVEGEELSEQLAAVRGWADSLDRNRYKVTETKQGLLVEQVPDPEADARLAESRADLSRGQEAMRIHMRYPERHDQHADHRPVDRDGLLADLAMARDLSDKPLGNAVGAGPLAEYDAPATVAAAALEAHFVDGIHVPDDDLAWAARLLVELMNALADQGIVANDYAVFGRGADHAAARGLPLLMFPAAGALRARLSADGVTSDSISRALTWIVESAANETRLFLVRAFDPIWNTPCSTSGARCHHLVALGVLEDTARRCLLGPWDPTLARRVRAHIIGPVAPRLATVKRESVVVQRLTATIRGAGAAASSTACCRRNAAALLSAALAAHRRGMRAAKHGYHHSATDSLAAARAVLDLAAAGDPELLFQQLEGYRDQPRMLREFLQALAAAGEESPARAKTARAVWPTVLDRVVDLAVSGALRRGDRYHGEEAIAAALPTPSYDAGYLHREYHGERILWADGEALTPQIERWLPVVAGHREGVDALAHLLERLPAERQASMGLPWMEQLVMADPTQAASQSYLLPEWLERVRPHVADQDLRRAWHRIVDALTVAGDHRVAALAD
ncbi:MAG: hypothetical protein A2V88_17160, partial [Elusimicrobia bacterium RBG_16_66_12]